MPTLLSRLGIRKYTFIMIVSGGFPLFAQSGFSLPVFNPFFQPAAGDFLLQAELVSYKQESQKVNFPPQAVAGVAFPVQASTEMNTKSFSTEAALRYAFTDYFIVGASGKYMIDRSDKQTSSSSFAAAATTEKTSSGFYDPGFLLGGRFLGTERDQTFLDAEFSFSPGIQDANNASFTKPNNSYGAQIGIGRNSGEFTYGTVLVFRHWQDSAADTSDTLNNHTIAGGAVFMQWDFEDFFVRVSAGGFKWVDSASNNSALRRQVTPTASLRLGFPLSEDVVMSALFEYTFPVSAEYLQGVLKGTFTNEAQMLLSGSLTSRF